MSFLRRLVGRPSPTGDPWATTPDWAPGITPEDFRRIALTVQREVGSRRVPDPLALRDFATAAELSIPNLIPVLVKIGPWRWDAALHQFYSQTGAFRAAGDAIEARSQSFEAATEALRIHWMPASARPLGDVAVDGPLADTVEVLALDAGASIRHVSERLFAQWNVTVEDAVRVARERVLSLPLTPLDLSASGHPEVRGLSLEREGPYVGALFHELGRIAPEAIGLFGSLVGVPVGNALLWRALNPEPELAGDLVALAAFTYDVAAKTAAETGDGFLRMPVWRRPDGRSTLVSLRIDDDGALLGSHHPGFSGALAALGVLPAVDVPGWARPALDPARYTRFAGCVAALRDVRIEDVARVASAWSLAGLAADCARMPFEDWPPFIADHLGRIDAAEEAAKRVIANAAVDPDTARRHLVTWLDAPEAGEEQQTTRPVGASGLVEVLGVYVDGHAVPMPEAVQASLGGPDELFALGADHIRSTLAVADPIVPMIAADARWVTGDPSPTGSLPHLLEWLPDLCGPYGAVVALGDADRMLVEPITDASLALDLPKLLSHAAGGASTAAWAVPATLLWVTPAGIDSWRLDSAEARAVASRGLALLIARLPGEPARLPPGLVESLGADGARAFYALLHAEVVARMQSAPADLVELTPISVKDFATGVLGEPRGEWRARIAQMLDEAAGPRRELDRLALATSYASVAPSLRLRVSRPDLAGSELVSKVPGGLVAFPVVESGRRYRRVTHEMLNRWGATADQCRADALRNTALDPDLVDEPMFADNTAVRQLYARAAEREAAALGLHLRHPGTRRGFAVSITHGSRAHYIALDDPRGPQSVPAFAGMMAEIYRAADAASDARSHWLVWLRPDGQVTELFDVLGPVPGRDGLPSEFVAMLETGRVVRAN